MKDDRPCWVSCAACASAYDVDRARVPAKGMTLRCPTCGHRFTFGLSDLRVPPKPDAALADELERATQRGEWERANELSDELVARRLARARASPRMTDRRARRSRSGLPGHAMRACHRGNGSGIVPGRR